MARPPGNERITALVKAYQKVTQQSQISGAKILSVDSGRVNLDIFYGHEDLVRNGSVKTVRSASGLISSDKKSVGLHLGSPHEVNHKLRSFDETGTYCAFLRNAKPGKAVSGGDEPSARDYIEIWYENDKIATYDLQVCADKQHGKVITDSTLGVFSFSHDAKKILYVAEEKRKSKTFIDETVQQALKSGKNKNDEQRNTSDDEDNEKGVMAGQLFDWHNGSWGEQLSSVVQPVIASMDVETGAVEVLVDPSKLGGRNLSPIEPQWTPDNEGIVFVGLENEPCKLGLIYCNNRPASLYHLKFSDGTVTDLSESLVGHVCQPRFRPDGAGLVFIHAPDLYGPHRQCERLMYLNWSSRDITVLLDAVENVPPQDFPGLHNTLLLPYPRCWSSDRLLMTTATYSKLSIVSVDSDGHLERISPVDDENSYCIADGFKNCVLSTMSSPSLPKTLVMWDLGDDKKSLTTIVPATKVNTNLTVDRFVPTSEFCVQDQRIREVPVETLLTYNNVQQDRTDKMPLIINVHGGPHSLHTTEYLRMIEYWHSLGYAVLRVNYRGSLGFGRAGTDVLPGRVGSLDVQDVQQSVVRALNKHKFLDGNRVFCMGGSHGGFLVTHLIGQFPDFYRACATVNPVVDLSAKMGCSDIPDWGVLEATGQRFDPTKSTTTPELLTRLRSVSPISHVANVRTPVIFGIGGSDLRVPACHSREYIRLLKTQGVPVRVLQYAASDHRIMQTDAYFDFFVNATLWFEEHGFYQK